MTELDLAAIRARVERAHDEVCGLCDGSRRWTMRVPAQPERDSDLVISAALDDAERLAAEVERLRAERRRLVEIAQWIEDDAADADEPVHDYAVSVAARIRALPTREDGSDG